MSEFFQDPPRLGNQYDDDALLRAYLRWRLPAKMLAEIEPSLRRLGNRAATDILALGEAAESSPPVHVPYDAWGRRVDRIDTSDAWRELDRISATEGIVATAYERAHGAHSRIDQFARLYLFAPSSALYSCPLAMTDGAARFLEVHGGESLQPVFAHLTSRDPNEFWTSGQWMTERTGGSDVGSTSTIARCEEGDTYSLYGSKWFTSATTSQVAMTLARIEGAPAGSHGLSVFLINLRDSDGTLRNIRVERLKDKLGTRALPTAELTLEGTPAQLVGGAGDGVRKIATLFNVTRVYNAVAAVAGMRRAIALASDYARRRRAFGKPLIEHPLHVETLADMQLELRAAFLLAFRVVELLGKEECGEATDAESRLLRFLIPVVKLYTAKQAIAVASEALEAFGGAGYVEDTEFLVCCETRRCCRSGKARRTFSASTRFARWRGAMRFPCGRPMCGGVCRASRSSDCQRAQRGQLGRCSGLRTTRRAQRAPEPNFSRRARAGSLLLSRARRQQRC